MGSLAEHDNRVVQESPRFEQATAPSVDTISKSESIKMKLMLLGLLFISIMCRGVANAACNAIVNNRPMSAELCRMATRIYGHVSPGHYLLDGARKWVKLDYPDAGSTGNIYRDARSEGPRRSGCRTGRHGPYATQRRAYEVAGNLRQQGCNVKVNTVGWAGDSPEYYVDAW